MAASLHSQLLSHALGAVGGRTSFHASGPLPSQIVSGAGEIVGDVAEHIAPTANSDDNVELINDTSIPEGTDQAPPNVRTNLAQWLQLRRCGYGGWIKNEGRHPEITFARPQNFVHVKLSDEDRDAAGDVGQKPLSPEDDKDAIGKTLDERSEKENHGEQLDTPAGKNLVYWDATFFLNGTQKITPTMKPLVSRVPYYMDCRRKQHLKLEIEVDVDASVHHLKESFFGGSADNLKRNQLYRNVNVQAVPDASEGNAPATKLDAGGFLSVSEVEGKAPWFQFPMSLDFQKAYTKNTQKGADRMEACKRICKAHKCPPAGVGGTITTSTAGNGGKTTVTQQLDAGPNAKPGPHGGDEFFFGRANCRDECVSPSFLEFTGWEEERKGLNGRYLMLTDLFGNATTGIAGTTGVEGAEQNAVGPRGRHPAYFRILDKSEDMGDALSEHLDGAMAAGSAILDAGKETFNDAANAVSGAASSVWSLLGGTSGTEAPAEPENDPDVPEVAQPPPQVPIRYPGGTLARYLNHDSPTVMEEFKKAWKLALILYNHEGDNKWGVYTVTRDIQPDQTQNPPVEAKFEILQKLAASQAQNVDLPSEVQNWVNVRDNSGAFKTENDQAYTPKVLYDYCRQDGLENPYSGAVQWNSKRVLHFDSPVPDKDDIKDVLEYQFYNRMSANRSEGRLCKYTKLWPAAKMKALRDAALGGTNAAAADTTAATTTANGEVLEATQGYPLMTDVKKLPDDMVFRIYEACRRHDRAIDADLGLRETLDANPHLMELPRSASIGSDVAAFRCLDRKTEDKIDGVFSGREVYVDESTAAGQPLGIGGRYRKVPPVDEVPVTKTAGGAPFGGGAEEDPPPVITPHASTAKLPAEIADPTKKPKYRSEYLQDGGRNHLFDSYTPADQNGDTSSLPASARRDVTRWHIAPTSRAVTLIDGRTYHPTPLLEMSCPDMGADNVNPSVNLLHELRGSWVPRVLDDELFDPETGTQPFVYEQPNKTDLTPAVAKSIGPEGTIERVRLDYGNKLELRTQDEVWEEEARVAELRGKVSEGSETGEEKAELDRRLLQRHRVGQWVIRNRDGLGIAAEPFGEHAPSPDKVSRWFFINPYKRHVTNEIARINWEPSYRRLAFSGDGGGAQDVKNFFTTETWSNSEDDVTAFNYERNVSLNSGNIDAKSIEMDAAGIYNKVTTQKARTVSVNAWNPISSTETTTTTVQHTANNGLSPVFWPGKAFTHTTRTPCLTSTEFNTGAKCIGGIKAAIELMRAEIPKCISPSPPCVKTFMTVAEEFKAGVEECITLSGDKPPLQTPQEAQEDGPQGSAQGRALKKRECEALGTDQNRCKANLGCKMVEQVIDANNKSYHCGLDTKYFGPLYPVNEADAGLANGAAFM